MNAIQKAVEEFRSHFVGFVSTDVVHIESGMSIAGTSADPEFNASVASSYYADLIQSNRQALDLLKLGAQSAEDILISTGKVFILLRMLGEDYYHCLVIWRSDNLGFARLMMRRAEPRFLAALG
ncbi:MAG TPA: hypothetical protein VMP03_07255 [Methylomirabilota bacterium]|nr:hypothetical protein [Methylomirabilota bacterium]